MLFFALCLVAALAGLVAYIRLASPDLASVHTPSQLYAWDHDGAWDDVLPMTGGASLRLSSSKAAPADLLVRLDTIAMATPRTKRLAGSVDQGLITWETSSSLWGFPDYTTAQVRPDGLYIHARLRFGKSDMGVNAARLKDWQSRL